MLKIHGLKKKFGNFHALNGLDMEIEDGALYGFVGPNGAGKTTAIRILTGLLLPDEGTVEIAGRDALKYREEVKTEFGYVPDEFGMYDNLKVREYMRRMKEFRFRCTAVQFPYILKHHQALNLQ